MKQFFNQTVTLVSDVQKHYKKKSGKEKKNIVVSVFQKQLIALRDADAYEEYAILIDFVENYLDDFIDVIIEISRNKHFVKLMRKSCNCFK